MTTDANNGWEPYPFVITKPPFCAGMVESSKASDNPLTLDEAGIMYDKVFGQLCEFMRAHPENRVYIPNIGVIFTHTVPENPHRDLPERYRYRLSCKPFPKSVYEIAHFEEENNNGNLN